MASRVAPCVALLVGTACRDDAEVEIAFDKHVIDPAYRSEGVTVFDVDRDGLLDLVTSELWYRAPSFTPHEVRVPREWDPRTQYCTTFGTFHDDVDADGFEDLILIGEPGAAASWCANPQGADRHWDCHVIAPSVSGESPFFAQVLNNSEPALFGGIEPDLVLGSLIPGTTPAEPWTMNPITLAGFPQAARYEHGLGLGDLNRDLRRDILTGSGWLEQPAVSDGRPWIWHAVPWCPNNCSNMLTYDVNSDGLMDVIGTSPHGYGVWWWEQQPGKLDEDLVFAQHEIDHRISQLHSARLVDLDGDLVPELITGKRWFAHFTQDIGALEPALLVVFRMNRSSEGVSWSRQDLDSDSGVGTQFEVVDVTGDAKPDIVVSNKKGLSLFEQR